MYKKSQQVKIQAQKRLFFIWLKVLLFVRQFGVKKWRKLFLVPVIMKFSSRTKGKSSHHNVIILTTTTKTAYPVSQHVKSIAIGRDENEIVKKCVAKAKKRPER